MKTPIVTLFGLLLINLLSEAYGCVCRDRNRTNKKDFCKATFVVRGIVKSKKDCGATEVEYIVKVKDTFKLQQKVKKIMRIRSPVHSCDSFLAIGSEYLISGVIRGEFYYTDYCYWYQIWQTIPKDTQTALETGTFAQCYSL